MPVPRERRDPEGTPLIIHEVRVDRRILTTPYACDPKFYDCQSQCCYRGCILNSMEIERIRRHLPKIASFLSSERKEILLEGDSFIADCSRQCPSDCEIHGLEWDAVRLHFPGGEQPHCLPYSNRMCLFAYAQKGVRLCSIHSFALEAGMPLSEIKPMDCIQYPLYLGEDKEGRFLGIQEIPHLSHIPCLRSPRGGPMVISLGCAIEALLGRDFYQALLQSFDRDALPSGAHRP